MIYYGREPYVEPNTDICYICGFDNEYPLDQETDMECFCCDITSYEWRRCSSGDYIIYFLRNNWIKKRNFEFIRKDSLIRSGFEIGPVWNIDVVWKQITDNVPKRFWENDPLYFEYINDQKKQDK